jgi:hypothetical protein
MGFAFTHFPSLAARKAALPAVVISTIISLEGGHFVPMKPIARKSVFLCSPQLMDHTSSHVKRTPKQ